MLQIILFLLGAFLFLFTFWKRLREDYYENQIFTTGFYIFLFVFVANLFSRYVANSYWFWFSFVGIVLAIIVSSYRFKMRFFEVFEASIVASFIPMILILLYDGFRLRHASSFFAIAVVTLFIGMYYFLNMHYKKISWYKSGKVGFSGLAVCGMLLLVRGVVAVSGLHVVSLSTNDWVLSFAFAFLSFLTIIHLSLKKS